MVFGPFVASSLPDAEMLLELIPCALDCGHALVHYGAPAILFEKALNINTLCAQGGLPHMKKRIVGRAPLDRPNFQPSSGRIQIYAWGHSIDMLTRHLSCGSTFGRHRISNDRVSFGLRRNGLCNHVQRARPLATRLSYSTRETTMRAKLVLTNPVLLTIPKQGSLPPCNTLDETRQGNPPQLCQNLS